jgi:glycosyltransferase involved in cell wall biosynthesis
VTLDIDILQPIADDPPSPGRQSCPIRHLALIGNALPRKCGLATFTTHVAEALRDRYPALILDHYAMDDESGVTYARDIRTIAATDAAAHRSSAAKIDASGAEAIWLQHEFGIFGGPAGSHILELLEASRLPLVITLHTVTDTPSDEENVVLRRLLARAEAVIVMASRGAEILRRRYGVDPRRMHVIPHGVPDRPLCRPDDIKERFGWAGRKVLMTFGLLAPDKGIRHMIEAMPAILAKHPDATYAVVGATHPNLVRHEGEAHRRSLEDRAVELGIADRLIFVDSFVEQEQLLDMLQASDVYITPYLNMNQVTSGTLSYAVAVGKPVVSTPYVHAREILADDHGVLVPPADPEALAIAVTALLDDDERRAALSRAAYRRGRTMLWPKVVERALAPLAVRRRPEGFKAPASPSPSLIPLNAITRMTDPVGMAQHARLAVADRDHGYCIDDNARALMVMAGRNDDEARSLAFTYAAFVQHGWNRDISRFRNFMSYDRRWLEPEGSEDSNGRTLWALGIAAKADDPGIRSWARHLFEESAPHLAALHSPRAAAFAALGAAEFSEHPLAAPLMRHSGEQLVKLHGQASRAGWDWFEPVLAYDNARLPEALIRSGQALGDSRPVELGLRTLEWLIGMQTGPRSKFRPIGSNGFGRPYQPPLAFDQQPLEAAATIAAASAAFEATGERRWHDVARQAFGWFFGDNDAGVPIADPSDGSCCDGLMATGINRNQGAESILSLHLAAQSMQRFGKPVRGGQDDAMHAEARPLALH